MLYFAAWSISFAIRVSKSSSLSKDSNFLLLWSKDHQRIYFSKVNVKTECGTFLRSNILYLPIRLSISRRFFFSCCKILIISSYNLYPEWSPNANLYFWSTPTSYESIIIFGNTNIQQSQQSGISKNFGNLYVFSIPAVYEILQLLPPSILDHS